MCEPVSIGATMTAIGSSIASGAAAAGAAVGTAAAATAGAIGTGAAAIGSGIASGASALGGLVGIGGAGAGAGAGAATSAGTGLAALNTAAASTWGSGLAAAGLEPVGASAGLAASSGSSFLANLGTIGSLASAGSAGYSGYEGKQQADYAAGEAKNNAKITRMQQGQEETRGQVERQNIRLNAAQVEGAGKAAFGAAGVQLGSGSTLSWAMDTAERAAYDIGVSQENTANRMWGLDVERQNYLEQSKMFRRRGSNEMIGGVLNSFGTFASNRFPSTWNRGYGYGGY